MNVVNALAIVLRCDELLTSALLVYLGLLHALSVLSLLLTFGLLLHVDVVADGGVVNHLLPQSAFMQQAAHFLGIYPQNVPLVVVHA